MAEASRCFGFVQAARLSEQSAQFDAVRSAAPQFLDIRSGRPADQYFPVAPVRTPKLPLGADSNDRPHQVP